MDKVELEHSRWTRFPIQVNGAKFQLQNSYSSTTSQKIIFTWKDFYSYYYQIQINSNFCELVGYRAKSGQSRNLTYLEAHILKILIVLRREEVTYWNWLFKFWKSDKWGPFYSWLKLRRWAKKIHELQTVPASYTLPLPSVPDPSLYFCHKQ